ncbi:MAG: peptidase S1 [Hyphomonadaceae bacterium]|nr:peptidase S1 [Hyphomonadaceae bacterium]
MPDYSLEPAYGVADLAAGFTPDPHTSDILAGGTIHASAVGENCTGWVARAPDYRVNWTAGSNGLPLVFSVTSEADTTLVINDAEGNWVCDDDSGNGPLNPSVSFATPVSGQYDVWVGTYAEGPTQPSVLNVSEISSQ